MLKHQTVGQVARKLILLSKRTFCQKMYLNVLTGKGGPKKPGPATVFIHRGMEAQTVGAFFQFACMLFKIYKSFAHCFFTICHIA